jgi:chemotaxis-related protein WspB
MLFLLFQIGEARYALDTATVLEIVPRVALQPVLSAPPGVAGLLDYHASPVPVLDLCELATGQPSETRFSTRLILVQTVAFADAAGPARVVGLLAERATSLLKRQPADFTSTGLHGNDAPFLGPVAADGEGFIHRVSVDALLTGPVRALLAAPEARLP